MEAKIEQLRRQIEGIIVEVSNYMAIRFAQVTRIKPGFASVYSDLLWVQIEKVRRILTEEKMFGAVRLRVVDVLCSRDEPKRRSVLAPIDQNSIMPELVPDEESMERRPGTVVVRSVRSLFTMVDTSLGPILELTNVWLWWDMPDASLSFNFKEQKTHIERRKSEPITKEIQDFYYQAMGRRDDRIPTREEILSYEFAYLELLQKSFMVRRAEEPSFMAMIKQDRQGDGSVDDLVVTMGRHIAARRRLGEEGGLDDRLRDYYSKVFKTEPSLVTVEQAVGHEDQMIGKLRHDLRAALDVGEVFGEPYNFKRSQAEEMGRQVEHYRRTLPLIDEIVKASSAGQVRATQPSAAGASASGASRPGQPKAAPKPAPAEPTEAEQPFMFGGE